jgi:MFS family permease
VLGCVATCLAFVFLAVAHDHPWEFYAGSAMLGVGIGLAFASLANLIVEAVRPDQTGVATGMNTVMRSVGGSVGSQIGASIIAGTVVGHALPTEHGFTVAFVLAAVACGLAALASLAVPRPGAPAAPRVGALVADSV